MQLNHHCAKVIIVAGTNKDLDNAVIIYLKTSSNKCYTYVKFKSALVSFGWFFLRERRNHC